VEINFNYDILLTIALSQSIAVLKFGALYGEVAKRDSVRYMMQPSPLDKHSQINRNNFSYVIEKKTFNGSP